MISARSLLRLGIAAGLAGAAFLPATSASAASDPEMAALPCSSYLNVYNIQVPGYVNCQVDNVGTAIGRIGDCTYYYDPLFPPFGSNVVPETLEYVDCI